MRKSIICVIAGTCLSSMNLVFAEPPKAQREYRNLPSARESKPLPKVETTSASDRPLSSKSASKSKAAKIPASKPLNVIKLAQGEQPPASSGPQVVTPELVPSTQSLPASPAPLKQGDKSKAKLLDTASMVGPMQDVGITMSQLNLKEDWRNFVEVIPDGPRATTNMIQWNPSAYTWTSPVFYHRPLYFEQPNLERYGNGPHRVLQPALSSAHFFMSAPLAPVKMLHNAPWADIYTLGEGRPGNNVPLQNRYQAFMDE